MPTCVSLVLISVSQTAAWLTETTSVSEEFGQHLSEPFALKTLLLHHRRSGTLSFSKFNRKDERNRVLYVVSICVKDQCLKRLYFLVSFLPDVLLTFLYSVLFPFFDNKSYFFFYQEFMFPSQQQVTLKCKMLNGFLLLQLLPAARKIPCCLLWPYLLRLEWRGSLSLTMRTMIMTMRKRHWKI